ncbi:MAG: topoisomerase protein, partial [Candidatus Uhrbacteria bacterium GW2011_GWF2_46_218]
ITSPLSEGPNNLLKMGAIPVTEPTDILPSLQTPAISSVAYTPSTQEESQLLTTLSLDPKHIDVLIEETHLSSSAVSSTLTLLEMKGIIKHVGSQYYIRVSSLRIITDISMQLLIVESPTKTKTISAFLGKDFQVLSSYGHIRDLPKSKTGVDVEHDFAPTYLVPNDSKKVVSALKKAAEESDTVYLATDSDREGEAIAWHIAQALELDSKKAKRITFHEITKTAIEEAIAHPRWLDMHLVNAQQTRRILDRLVGYELSPLLWRKVRSGLSAGRVQSVAVRLVVDRERERDAFKIEEYWSLDALFEKEGQTFEGKLTHAHGQKLEKLSIKNEAEAQVVLQDLASASYQVTQVEKQEVSKAPPVPFTTASLQMEANKKLGFSAKQTMKLAQDLYETGRISYMRTDSLTLADKFLGETQQYIVQTLGAAKKERCSRSARSHSSYGYSCDVTRNQISSSSATCQTL